jgi:uncharacterized pyridoxal phosphate-containing UPF0001 family protein
MNKLLDQWRTVLARMEAACVQCNRSPQDVKLLAVSKTVPFARVAELVRAGQVDFGENYIQEAMEKIEAARLEWSAPKANPSFSRIAPILPNSPLSPIAPIAPLCPIWHCIGPVQSNKTKWVATHFDWLHTLDRLKIAQRLSEQRPADMPPLKVLIQVNVDHGQTKSGIPPEEVLTLAKGVMGLPRLSLKGIMTLPDPQPDSVRQVALHRVGRAVFDLVLKETGHPGWDTLSMGMTQDLEAAIFAGSTLVRVGTAIFGARDRAQAQAV